MRVTYEFIRDEGSAKTREVREHTWANSETGYSNERSMWKNCVSKGLKQLAEDDPDLHPPSEGEHTWRSEGIRE